MTAALASIGCIDCGQLYAATKLTRGDCLTCRDCRNEIERTTGRSIPTAFAFAVSTFLLLWPANFLPLMRTTLLGQSQQGLIGSGASNLLGDGWPDIAFAVGMFSVALPVVRFGLLSLVLGTIVAGGRPPWLGRAFRVANWLQPWAMTEVFLVAFLIAYQRLKASVDVTIEDGGFCLIAAGTLALLTRAALDKAQVWRAIGPEPALPADATNVVMCAQCELILPESADGAPCPRCAATIDRRLPDSTMRAAALVIAGALLYLPANLYPMATLPINGHPQEYTVLQGVIDLAEAKLVGLAAVVFIASFAIPMVKLAGLGWCVVSVVRRSTRHLRAKTAIYRFVEEIGRWSMLDPFIIACFAPVMSYNVFATARAEAAVPFFTGVVMLTMLASQVFDPRRMWDAAGRRG